MTKQKQELMTAAATFDALSVQAQHGDRRAMDTLRQVLSADRPDWENSITAAVDSVRQTMLEATLRDDLVLREAWERKTSAWQHELEGEHPTPLERILCERVATCWLEMQLTDVGYHNRLRNQNGLTFAQSSHWQRRQDRAHKRYVTACLALAKARRLLRPVLQQVNIARAGAQQMNVATPGAVPIVASPPIPTQVSAPTVVPADPPTPAAAQKPEAKPTPAPAKPRPVEPEPVVTREPVQPLSVSQLILRAMADEKERRRNNLDF